VVATYYDSNIFEHGWTWIASGRAVGLLTLRALAWHTFRVARRLLTNSEYCRAQILRRYPRLESKLFVNPVGVTPPPAPPDTPPSWADALRKRPYFLCAGAFSENKGQRRLLGAWKYLQEKHPDLPLLLLLGPCQPDYWQRAIAPALQQLPRANEVLYPGHVSGPEMSWAFHHAHGYVQPSIAEGFSSFSVFDAMSCGVPVACSNSTSHPEGTGGAVRFFDPYQETDMAEAIRAIWRDDRLRRDLAARGRARINELSWRKNAENVMQHLHHVIT
jgi:glycosyltransferase involved in cell wall biosynthesis